MVTMIRSDLDFILAQIKIAEADARGEPLLGTYIPNSELPWGLRRVDGSNNNLLPGQGGYGSADQPFPSAVAPSFVNESDDGMAFGPPMFVRVDPSNPQSPYAIPLTPLPGFEGDLANGVPPGFRAGVNFLASNDYGNHTPNDPSITNPRAIQPGDVVDADPRTISNLIVDQTANNPAAIFKALQVAGSANPFADMQVIVAAVGELNAAKAAGKPFLDALTLAQKDVITKQAALDAAIAANATQGQTIDAYADALSALPTLNSAITAAAQAFNALSVEVGVPVIPSPGNVTDLPDDALALTAARTAATSLLSAANALVDALLQSANVIPGDLEAAQDILLVAQSLNDVVTLAQNAGGINVANGVNQAERGRALDAAGDAASLELLVDGLDAQLQGSLDAAISADSGIAAANSALVAAQAALDAAEIAAIPYQNSISTEQVQLKALLDLKGIAYEESPTGDFGKATLVVENVAPDAGLSAPFNGWMTLFGQFFDHGLDLVGKGGYGTVYVPLQPDDPLYVQGSSTNFMALTRSTLDENGNAVNKVTPFVDQNQTYTSNPSAQVFHREYELRDTLIRNPAQLDVTAPDAFITVQAPHATGRLLNGSDASGGGLATWADIKAQAKNVLGIELNDSNIHDIPEIVVDPYGNFIPGPNGFPQLVRGFGPPLEAVEGNLTTPVKTAEGQVSTGHAFLDDIAHNANPDAGEVADADTTISTAADRQAGGTYDDELLDRHYITGDGRGNENIGLTAVHHVFHAEHNRQIDLIKTLLIDEAKAAATALADGITTGVTGEALEILQADAADKLAFLNEWLDVDRTPGNIGAATIGSVVWDGERLFQAAKFPTEMQYQHLVFEEFARTVQPFVNVFNDYNGQLDPAILAEFAHTVYRFGHSMLTETVDRLDENNAVIGSGGEVGAADQIGLIEAFLNPVEFTASDLTAEQAAGAIARGMTRQVGNEIDEFVTEALRNNLVGLPLDLAALNIARGRETGVPTLNVARAEFYEGSGDSQVRPYMSWVDFAANLKNPASIINFIAAYGTHASIEGADTLVEKRDAAWKLVFGDASLTGTALTDFEADRAAFLNAKGGYAGGTLGGLNNVDFWIGGLAEKQMAFGGMLGTTFNFVFEVQMENLQNGDRFYYLSRLANLNLTAQLENNKFAEMIHRNTDATHLPGNVFKAMDYQLEVDQSKQYNGGADTWGGADGIVGDDPLTLDIDEAADDVANAADPTGVANGLDPFLSVLNGDKKVIRTNPDGSGGNYLQFIGGEHVVLGGTNQNDTLIGDEGDDTIWGDEGDDRIEGGIGNDFAFGGEGNDWLESGLDNGLMLGDNGDLIQGLPIKRSVDSPIVGNDVLVATGGNADFDAETGDDIMVGGLGTDRFFGAFGFDWATYKNDPTGIEADMQNRLFAPPSIAGSPGAILDRYAQTESLSGSAFTDFLRGDDEVDLAGGGGELTATGLTVAVPPDHALKDRNVSLIDGLAGFLGPVNEEGENSFSTGNILLGGAGSDVIEGRGGDDLIDGDRWLDVQIRVNPAPGSTAAPFLVNGMSEIQERMFSGEIKVSQLEIVRSIKTTGALGSDVDVAEFSGARADYAVEGLNALDTGASLISTTGYDGFGRDLNGDGFISVSHLTRDAAGAVVVGTPGIDGTDRLKNIERALFSDQTIKLADHTNTIATGAPIISSSTPTVDIGTVLTASLAGIVDPNGVPVFTGPNVDTSKFTVFWQVELAPGSGIFTNIQNVVADEFAPVTGSSFTVTAAEGGLNVRALVRFKDGAGAVETVVSAPVSAGGAAGGGPLGAPVVTDPAAILGFNLQNVVVDGVALPFGTIGILEDAAPFQFSAAQLLAGATDPNGDALTVPPASVVIRQRDGDPVPGTLAFDAATQLFTFTPAANFNGGVTFTFDVTDGVNITPAEATLDVIPVNDAPTGIATTAGDVIPALPAIGAVVAQLATADVDLNDRATFTLNAGSSANFTVSPNGAVTVATALANNTTYVLNLTATDEVGASVNETIRVITGSGASATSGGSTGDDIMFGLGGADTLNGLDGDDMLVGGGGGDRLNGGAGNDTVVWSVGDGNGNNRDVVNGGLGGTDTFVVNGDDTAEAYQVFTAAAWLNLGGTRALLNAGSDIVITRGGTGNGAVVAELDEIEEIIINTGLGVDTVDITGDFAPTNLAINTITVENEGEDGDEVDVTGVESEHRAVLKGNGSITGKRAQDEHLTPAGDSAQEDEAEDAAEDEIEDDYEEETEEQIDDEVEDDLESDSDSAPPPAVGEAIGPVMAASGSAANTVVGTVSADTMFGDDAANNLVLQGGDDTVFALGGDDIVMAGDGNDHLDAGSGHDKVFGGAGNDTIFAGDGDDVIFGDAGRDIVWAGGGNDTLFFKQGDGNGQMHGEGGTDTLNLSSLTVAANVDLNSGGSLTVGSEVNGLSSIENVIGGSGDDTITGNSAVNVLDGGAGADTFVFETAADAAGDKILGFQSGDRIDFSKMFALENLEVTYVDGDTVVSGDAEGGSFELTVVDQHIDLTKVIV